MSTGSVVHKEDSSKECKAIFEAAKNGLDLKINDEWKNFVIEVPIITDCYGMQPLDYAFGLLSRKDDKTAYRYLNDTRETKKIEQAENLALVQEILEQSKEYESFTNTTNMVYPIIQGIKCKLPEAFNYLDCRLRKMTHIQAANKNDLKSQDQ